MLRTSRIIVKKMWSLSFKKMFTKIFWCIYHVPGIVPDFGDIKVRQCLWWRDKDNQNTGWCIARSGTAPSAVGTQRVNLAHFTVSRKRHSFIQSFNQSINQSVVTHCLLCASRCSRCWSDAILSPWSLKFQQERQAMNKWVTINYARWWYVPGGK